ncbi:hypothetical protein L245_36710 [Salmonella enterica subsp. enterica serovar Worthington str. BCH-4719]|nr:hypothetical protein L245_36710 [Salmonella enterica subsp. enterica serovar Worthington str. BCH-4719]
MTKVGLRIDVDTLPGNTFTRSSQGININA